MKSELTEREFEVLVGISQGLTNGQIGTDLFLSVNTVKVHSRNLSRKLGARDRASAVAIAFKTGLLTTPGNSQTVDRVLACLKEFAQENLRLQAVVDSCTCSRPALTGLRSA